MPLNSPGQWGEAGESRGFPCGLSFAPMQNFTSSCVWSLRALLAAPSLAQSHFHLLVPMPPCLATTCILPAQRCSFCTNSACCWLFSVCWHYLLSRHLSTSFCGGCSRSSALQGRQLPTVLMVQRACLVPFHCSHLFNLLSEMQRENVQGDVPFPLIFPHISCWDAHTPD